MTPDDLVVTKQGLRFQGRRFPCSIGRGGIVANKQEGDGGTPRAELQITGCLYRPDRVSSPNIWAKPIRIGDLWSDASDDTRYNTLVRAPHAFSHEVLRRADPLYDLVLLTDWNWPNARPGKGSAIFVHTWRKPRHPTEGCVALASADLRYIAQRIRPGTRLILS
ncbi:MAG: L,D-transpeptidase family protein [Marinosulfonomonas sp.]|nr:L,D-transpeptidase family protein [Marinosulfonomonas sp.]